MKQKPPLYLYLQFDNNIDYAVYVLYEYESIMAGYAIYEF